MCDSNRLPFVLLLILLSIWLPHMPWLPIWKQLAKLQPYASAEPLEQILHTITQCWNLALLGIACLQHHSRMEFSNVSLKLLITAAVIILQNLFVFCKCVAITAILHRLWQNFHSHFTSEVANDAQSSRFAVLNWAPSPVSLSVDRW